MSSDPFDYDHGMPEPCLVLDYRPIQRDPSERWAHLAKPPLPSAFGPLHLDPETGLRLLQEPDPAPAPDPRCAGLDCNHLRSEHDSKWGCDRCPCGRFEP